MPRVTATDPSVVLKWNTKTDADVPEAERFVIHYSHLDMRQSAEVDDAQFKNIQKKKTSELKYLIGQMDVRRLELAIRNWENLPYPDGHPKAGSTCPYSKENIT